jgi:hypothetical protein
MVSVRTSAAVSPPPRHRALAAARPANALTPGPQTPSRPGRSSGTATAPRSYLVTFALLYDSGLLAITIPAGDRDPALDRSPLPR